MFDQVMDELKNKQITSKNNHETFKNKLKYCDTMDQLIDEFEKGRTRPSQIRNRQKYGYFYRFLKFFGF